MSRRATKDCVGNSEIARPDAVSAELVRRCLRGEAAAQRELFRMYSRGVHATLYRILGTNKDIEDLIQETFIQVFRSLSGFRAESKLATWIGKISTRVAFAYIRKRKRQVKTVSDDQSVWDLASNAPAPDQAFAARRAVVSLYAVLDRLDAKHRIAYALHVIDGRGLAEVAELTEASLSAVKTRVWRARREVNKRASKNPELAGYLVQQVGQQVGR